MAKKGDNYVHVQIETRGAAKRQAMEITNKEATAACSIASIAQPTSSSIPTRPDIPESTRGSRNPAETTTPLRNRDTAPHPLRLHQAASNRPPTSQHQVVRGAISASTPNPDGEAIHTTSKKQNTKKKEVTVNRQATERHQTNVDNIGEEAEEQPKGAGPAKVLVDEEMQTVERFSSFSDAPVPTSLTLGSHTLTDWDIEHWTNEELEVINQDDIQSFLDVENAPTEAQVAAAGQETEIQPELSSDGAQWSEHEKWGDLNLEGTVEDEFTWGNHIWREVDTSIEESRTTNLDPQTPPSPHPAWTGRGLLAAAIASSGGLEQYPVHPVSGETQTDTLGLFMSAQDREEMADAELPSPGLTTFSVNSAVDSIDTEAFVEGLSREILDTNFDPDLPSDMLEKDR